RPDVPPELEAVYSRMVAKNPDERFQSMTDVIRALEHVRSIEGAAGGPSLAAAVVAEDASDDTSFPNGLTNPPSAQRLGRGGLGTTVLYDGSQSAAPEAAPGRRGRTPSRRTLIAMASLVLAAVAAVIVIVRNREGKEVARLQLDEGATIEVQSAGGPAAASIAPSANGRRDEDPPPDQPTPRETAHWVLGRGGKLIVVVGDASREVTAADQLPDGKFHIRRIDFRGVKMISDNGFARIASLGELEQLYLGESSVSDKALVHVRDLKALKVLDLLKTRVTDDGMPHLTRLRNLSLLNLQGTRVTDAGVEPLKSLTGLGQLTLRETRVTEAGKSDFEAAVPGCRVVWP
ncbi:MAG: hypothetical protein KY476_26465, partial [Planctomycetes bacterium]|nr:hypothetical protein [Planctomycetota bacterium]